MVSIIIPFIDEYEFLREALTSAMDQQYTELEIILVCNAPQLSEARLPEDVSDPKVKVIHEPLAGSAHARNAGLAAAGGEWIQFLDADDLLLPEKILHQTKAEHADVVVSPHHYRYLSGKEEHSKWLPQDIWTGLLNSGLGSTSSMLWRREVLVAVGGWNTGYSSHQEYELLFRLLMADRRIVPLDRVDTIVRQRKSGSITSQSQPVRAMEGIRLREAMWIYLDQVKQQDERRFDAFRQYIFKQLRNYFRREPSTALFLYKKYFSERSFTPRDMHIAGYNIAYKLFGFELTEQLLYSLVRLRKGIRFNSYFSFL